VSEVVQDLYLNSLRKARESSAVAKLEFGEFVSTCTPDKKVFAFEGVTDKKVYYYWLRSIDIELNFAFYVCKTKSLALQLYEAIIADEGDLIKRVYFFVDRDFDDAQGRPASEKLYITDRYSIENYLVCQHVLNDLLIVELHCNGVDALRTSILGIFNDLHKAFLQHTQELNFRIFSARRLGIAQIGDLPNRIDVLAQVELGAVSSSGAQVTDLVILEREPTSSELEMLRPEFDKFDPILRYRGKFSWLFFMKWLGLLASDRSEKSPKIFVDCKLPDGAVPRGFGIDAIASKSRAPESLRNFISQLTATKLA
jgi:hypothetical protein